MANELIAAVSPVTRRVRAFFAPVNRVTGQTTLFDAGGIATFNVDQPAQPWIDLGWCSGFTRRSGTRVTPLMTGSPATSTAQVKAEVDALVSLEFASWGKLQMALTAGSQQMNVLRVQAGSAANGSGGAAIAAVPLVAGSTATSATTLDVGVLAAAFVVGDVVAVDVDFAGATGYVGSGVSGGYVKSVSAIGADPDYVRRVTLNVGRVTSIASGVLTLGAPLLAGVPSASMRVSKVVGFCDREGGSFFQEWSALFVMDGEQGDRVMFHYPRLQAAAGPAEKHEGLVGVQTALSGGFERLSLAGSFRALPVKDANDGEQVVCFRTYLPGPMRAV
jgi:hypothetical protein